MTLLPCGHHRVYSVVVVDGGVEHFVVRLAGRRQIWGQVHPRRAGISLVTTGRVGCNCAIVVVPSLIIFDLTVHPVLDERTNKKVETNT